MKLNKLSDRIYYSDYEEERDRPALGYIKGDKFSVVIDAGHSKEHLDEFYQSLKDHNLTLPDFTIITHWHWDHSFAMHAVNGKTITSCKTNNLLTHFIESRTKENDERFIHLDPTIEKEYANNKPLIVCKADIIFENKIEIDAGGLSIKIFEVPSPHTDDCCLIYIQEEKTLFIGDATSGPFPTWIVDPIKAEPLINILKDIDFKYCIGGHWPIENKEETINRML